MGAPIWLIASNFEPRGRTLYTLRLAAHLPEFGFEPVIVCQSASRIHPKLRSTLKIIEVPRLAGGFLHSLAVRRLVQQHSGNRPALIHAQRQSLSEVAIELADRLDCPYLVTIHDLMPADRTLTVDIDRLEAIIAVSPSVERDLVIGAGVPAQLIRTIASGVDLPSSPRIPALRETNDIPIVGCASALEPVKGIAYFLMAAELVLSSGYDVEFLVAGSGPDEQTLRRAAQHLDIANRVTFVNYLHDYGKILDTFDVFVCPSLQQGLGTLMLEAMALSKPVVASKVGGIADFFVDGEHALLVPPENHVILADKIRHLLDNPDKSRSLALAGQQFVRKRFPAERMTRETARLYEEILQRQRVEATS